MSTTPLHHQFTDLEAIIDRLHGLFEEWDGHIEDLDLSRDTFELMKLSVHEWIANLVQHADFGDISPRITLTAASNGVGLECHIEDNSRGFDLNRQLEIREGSIEHLPERGMGLLMIRACSEDLVYRRIADRRQCLSFVIPSDQDPWLNIPF